MQVSLRGVCSGKTKERIYVLCFSRLIRDSMTSDVYIWDDKNSYKYIARCCEDVKSYCSSDWIEIVIASFNQKAVNLGADNLR